MRILAGDIGGTNVRLAIFESEGTELVEIRRERYRTSAFAGIDAVVASFLRPDDRIDATGLGVCGPVSGRRAFGTNLPWDVDGADLERRVPVGPVVVVNDLAANGLGLPRLAPSDFAVLNQGIPDPQGSAVLISPGTGLGEGILVRQPDGSLRPIPSEGGHCTFAPRTEREMDLQRFLSHEFGHVSCERVLSGPGLVNIYRFLRQRSGRPEPEWLAARAAAHGGDLAPVISKAALAGEESVCMQALETFVSILGAEAANLALKALATGGVFIGGGIAPKILPKLLDGTFFTAFCDKGRFGPALARIPVKVVLNDDAALLGGAVAAKSAGSGL